MAVSGLKWHHQVGVDGDGYLIFSAPEWGIRAAGIIIQNYKYYHGLDTIRQIITRWAPPASNPTAEYIRAVASACRVEPTDVIDVCKIAFPMCVAMIHFENGMQPYSIDVIDRGIELAHLR